MAGYIFGGNTGVSYDELQRQRALAMGLMKQDSKPRNAAEGLASAVSSVAGGLMNRGLNKTEASEREKKKAEMAAVLARFGGGGFSTKSYGATAPYAAPPVDPNSPHALGDDAMSVLGKPPVRTAADPASIKAGLVARGLPEHVAEGFVMNFEDESGLNPGINEIAPTVPGSRGGFGLYQLTGPRRVAYEQFAAERGVPVDDVDAQLDFLMTELQGPEAGAASAILSTKTPGEAGAAIVNEFLRPAPQHAASRTSEYLGGQSLPPDTMSAQNAPSGGGGFDMELITTLSELAQSPYSDDSTRMVAGALLQQEMAKMQPPDPMAALELERAQLEIEQLRNPPRDKPTSDIQNYEYYAQGAVARGEQPLPFEEWSVMDEKATVPPGAAPGIPPDEEALRTSLGKKEGEAWSTYLDAANTSAGTMQDMQMLDELITMAPQGPVIGRLANAFTGVNSAADAFNSVVKRVAPTLRAPGSGATSDVEYEGMLKSLPQLSANPEANAAISAMVKAKAAINIERGKVVAAYQNGEISASDARKAMSEINGRSIMTPELKAILGQTAPLQPGSDMSEDDAAYLRSLGLEP